MCGQSLVYFGSSVIYINGVHIHNRQDYYCAGAIISFKFSFHANVVSNIADIMINIEIIINIADRGKKRCRIRTPEGFMTSWNSICCDCRWIWFSISEVCICCDLL